MKREIVGAIYMLGATVVAQFIWNCYFCHYFHYLPRLSFTDVFMARLLAIQLTNVLKLEDT